MGQKTARNHFVPECYLKRWGNAERKVYVYRTLVSHRNVYTWKSHSVSSIAYQNHLYTRMLSGVESDDFERWLDREFESPANAALEKATAGKKLTEHDWHALIKFLAAQDVRTPSRLFDYLKRNSRKAEDLLREIMADLPEKIENKDFQGSEVKRMAADSEGFPLKVLADFDEGADTGVLTVKTYVGRLTWIHGMKYLLNNTRKHLHDLKWSIVRPAKGYFWPTSDNPVVKVNYYQSGDYDLKGGWGSRKTNIIFPIGPEHAMFVQVGDKPPIKNTRLSIDKTQIIIKLICENAHRAIFSDHVNEAVLEWRPRIVDADAVKRERQETKEWHIRNAEMEIEYLPQNSG